MTVHYSYNLIQRIIRMRMANMHPAEIAEHTGRTKRAIDRILSVEKSTRNLQYPKLERRGLIWNNDKIEEIALKTREYSYRQIAKQHFVSGPRIAFLLAKRAHELKQGTWIN